MLVVPAPQLKEKFFLALVAMRARVGTDEGLAERSICASFARRHAIVGMQMVGKRGPKLPVNVCTISVVICCHMLSKNCQFVIKTVVTG